VAVAAATAYCLPAHILDWSHSKSGWISQRQMFGDDWSIFFLLTPFCHPTNIIKALKE